MYVVVENILDEVRGAWRYRWIALCIAWGLSLIAWAVIFVLPDSYQASARVFVDTRTALSEVTRGISVESHVDSQIIRVRQALLGGPQLQRVAQETDLLVGTVTPREKQFVTDGLRKRIEISGGISRDSPTSGVYLITYKHRDRETSLKVVDRLLNTFVEGALGGKREGSEQAQQFLIGQIADYERRLTTAEGRLADFKKRNVGLMPGAQGDYFSRLQGEMAALSQSLGKLGVAARRKEQIERQLRGEQPFLSTASDRPGAPTGGGNDTATRIRETQARLDDMLLRFTEKHPDVLALRATLTELEQRQRDEIASVRRGDPGAAARSGLSANPVFQSIQLQYNEAEVDMAATRAEIAEHERKIANLKSLVDTAPEVEAEFARLNRDYDVTRAQYQALLERLERSRLSEEAEATGIVRFEVIDPPTASFTPVDPNRPLLIVAALVLALGAGGGAAYLLHLLKPVFSSTRQLHEVTGLPVLGAVSMTWLDKYKTAMQRDVIAYAGAAGALVAVMAVVLLVQNQLSQFARMLIT